MKKTSRYLMVFALAALSLPPVWSEAASTIGPESAKLAPMPPDAAMTPASAQAPGQAALPPEVEWQDGPDTRSAARNQVYPPASAPAVENPQGAGRDNPAAYQSWIDKVRAQRKARVQEHREAMEARRNYLAPSWDHPQHESIEVQREKMREAWQIHNERREQAQREHRRRANPHGEFMKEMHNARRQLMEAEAEEQRMQADLLWQRQQEWMYGQMPPGWNNPWYYRGY